MKLLRGWVGSVLVLLVAALAIGGFAFSFKSQEPRFAWSTEFGQSVVGSIVRLLAPAGENAMLVGRGDAMPVLELRDMDGTVGVIGPLETKKLVINFWSSACAECVRQMALLDTASKSNLSERVRIIGVSVDKDLEIARQYLAANPVSYRLYYTPPSASNAKATLGGGGGDALPYTVLVGIDGKIEKARFLGFRPGELEEWVE
jgi:thiol-disulfide isomerase/thioredoxin